MAQRVCVNRETVCLQEITEDDWELIMAWRSHPLIRSNFILSQTMYGEWTELQSWWDKRGNRKDFMIILEADGWKRKVGMASAVGLEKPIIEIGIYIGEIALWGKGIGSRALQLLLDWLKASGHQQCFANIENSNVGSQRLFIRLGFQRVGVSPFPDGSRYERKL